MSKIIVVSNRLPIKISINENGNIDYQKSEGGLATGLASAFDSTDDNLWIGWPGATIDKSEIADKINTELAKDKLVPVFLTEQDIDGFYEGFSNATLWPLFHYFTPYVTYHTSWWEAYETVNQKFFDAIVPHLETGDTVWIQDYHLMLLPKLIKARNPNIKIGFFLHIPFPSFEIFRLLPWRKELLEGVIYSDLVGFHTIDDVNHFLDSSTRILGARTNVNNLLYQQHTTVVDAFPMGINYEYFNQKIPSLPLTKQYVEELDNLYQDIDIILSIDRLDYSKGIIQRLRAFEYFLKENSDSIGKVSLFMIVVPSRDSVAQYAELKNQIDTLVGNINAQYRTLNWQPIQYFYQSFSMEYLSALYQTAKICLVTPMRDGMNLVCKEFVASRTQKDGILILSEMAGAAKELFSAVRVNPNDIHQIGNAIQYALEMPMEEQQSRMGDMQDIVSKFTVSHWVKIFFEKLTEVTTLQQSYNTKYILPQVAEFKQIWTNSKKRLLVLDYDGTLVGFKKVASEATPDAELMVLLTKLAQDPQNEMAIVSGRDNEFLAQHFGHLPITLIAEHGVWFKYKGAEWQRTSGISNEWIEHIRPKLQTICDRTPGSLIEEKSFSLAWHYRNVDENLGMLRANGISSELNYFIANEGLQILMGDKVVEIKRTEINKGAAIRKWLEQTQIQYDISLSFGDDSTDEDIFKTLNRSNDYTVKVGQKMSAAKYYVLNHEEVRKFLQEL